MNKKLYGKTGEEIALAYLLNKGYAILASNFSCHGGELDLVVRDKKGVIVFVEVKRRFSDAYGTPAEAVTKTKQHRMVIAAQMFLMKNDLQEAEVRFDIVEIYGEKVNHIKNAFEVY